MNSSRLLRWKLPVWKPALTSHPAMSKWSIWMLCSGEASARLPGGSLLSTSRKSPSIRCKRFYTSHLGPVNRPAKELQEDVKCDRKYLCRPGEGASRENWRADDGLPQCTSGGQGRSGASGCGSAQEGHGVGCQEGTAQHL